MIVETPDLREIFDLPDRTLRRYVAEGLPVHQRGGPGRPHQFDSVAVHEWLKARRLSSGRLDLEQQRARLAKEQAARLAMANERLRAGTASVHDVAGLWAKLASETRHRLLRAAAEVIPRLRGVRHLPEAQDIIDSALRKALDDIAGTAPHSTGDTDQ